MQRALPTTPVTCFFFTAIESGDQITAKSIYEGHRVKLKIIGPSVSLVRRSSIVFTKQNSRASGTH